MHADREGTAQLQLPEMEIPERVAEPEPKPKPKLALELAPGEDERHFHLRRLRAALRERSPTAVALAEEGLRRFPGALELLLLAALAALVAELPVRALAYVKRFHKRYDTVGATVLLTALALAQQGKVTRAWGLLQRHDMATPWAAMPSFVGGHEMYPWLRDQFEALARERKRLHKGAARPEAARKRAPPRPAARPSPPPPAPAPPPPLPRTETGFDVQFELVNPQALLIESDGSGPEWFRLRAELGQLGLLQGFDELLCLPTLRGVEAHGYQIETVRKVLKQFRGRVLLADEVGLGKTIEAGMVLKEYALRGMAERMLILTPAALVGQWRDEMAGKFGIDCATSHDALLRSDPAGFWAQPRIIASIAAARRKEHAALLAGTGYDVVVVDEAHHMRDPASASYRLVDRLQKRFLLLLSATPVQNDLLELYHLLTLLQPGIFKTQKDFKAAYVTPGKPREPANSDRLRELMRGVMIRNTRALADLRLPPRHASTLRAQPSKAEALCYRELTALARELGADKRHRLSLQHLLSAAGSSPAAAAAALARFSARDARDERWSALQRRYEAIAAGAKEATLCALLARNPDEKKMVFVHHRHSLAHLAGLLRRQGVALATFDGGMTGPEKDAAVDAFRDEAPVLLCSESGGEGRNLQFCNTLINFDIPWNPMAIEQRIGRIDRIGQTREVFIFNLVTSGTIEDEVLRILDDKINMFELVVGEVGAILGEIDEEQDFSTLVLEAWLQSTADAPQLAFAALEERLTAARRQYDDVKQLDDALFGDGLEAA
ncbi:MAG TPA: SNF2-related protein [Stellaceae bacterium]|nr:SNF2-related protein [Stellaceae bacterium]